jgi:hypothetical protein
MAAMRTAAVLSWMLVAAAGRAEPPAVEAARAREARFRACAVEFGVTETVTHQVRPDEPQRKTTFTKAFRLTLDGDRLRVESEWVGPPPPKFNFVMPPGVAVFDGELTKVFCPTGKGMDGQPEGLIDPSPRQQAAAHGFIPPVVLQFVRPLDPAMTAYPLDRFAPTGVTKPNNGVECVEYAHSPRPEITDTYWLAPSQDYVVARFEHRSHGRVTEWTNATHRLDPALGWVLDGWMTTRYSDAGAVTRKATGTVTRWRVGIGFADGPLDLTFPEGTVVADQRDSKFYRVKANGSWRELDVTGDEVPEPVERPWYRRYAWLGAVAVVLGAVVLARVLRRRAPRGSGSPLGTE